MTKYKKKYIQKKIRDGSSSRLIRRCAMPNIIKIGPQRADILEESHFLGMISIAAVLSAT
jgi:hypothetical protein